MQAAGDERLQLFFLLREAIRVLATINILIISGRDVHEFVGSGDVGVRILVPVVDAVVS